jgi:uncharacterized membrane protein
MADSARKRVHDVALALTITLIVLVAAWVLARGPTLFRVLLALAATGPLGVGLWRLRNGERRVYAWMTLIVIPYMALGLMEAVANPHARLWAGACVFTAFALFAALIGCLRATRPAPSPSSG